MIDNVAGERTIPANIRQDIIERSDGVPLFVEEVTKAVLEAENQSVSDRITQRPPLKLRSPGYVARFAYGSSRSAGRSEGSGTNWRRDWARVLLCSFGCGGAATRGWNFNPHSIVLSRLVCCFRQGVPPHATYLFKHALVQDAAYGTLLREPRRALHARIAETLESQFAEIAENQPEVAGASLH